MKSLPQGIAVVLLVTLSQPGFAIAMGRSGSAESHSSPAPVDKTLATGRYQLQVGDNLKPHSRSDSSTPVPTNFVEQKSAATDKALSRQQKHKPVTSKNAKNRYRGISDKRSRPALHHHHKSNARIVLDDCNACHTGCLVASLTCIAISIATGCLPCGVICLVGQAACEGVCNTTSACKAVVPEEPPQN